MEELQLRTRCVLQFRDFDRQSFLIASGNWASHLLGSLQPSQIYNGLLQISGRYFSVGGNSGFRGGLSADLSVLRGGQPGRSARAVMQQSMFWPTYTRARRKT